MKFDWVLFVDLLKTFAWPLVVGFALYLFRRPIIELVSQIIKRAKRLSVYSVSVDLASLEELTPPWSVGTVDVRQLTSAEIFDSYSDTLFTELLSTQISDFAIVDLGKGKEWLTSRLYVFSLVLGEIKNLKAFVFLESIGGHRRRFLGTATPASVRRKLAVTYPWFEEAFISALSKVYTSPVEQVGVSKYTNEAAIFSGAVQWKVTQFVRQLVENLQRTTTPPDDEMHSYLEIGTEPQTWERAYWIDGERLERDLAGILNYSWCEDSPDIPRKTLIESIIRRPGPFVAKVDEDRRFLSLVDKNALLERAWDDFENSKNQTDTN